MHQLLLRSTGVLLIVAATAAGALGARERGDPAASRQTSRQLSSCDWRRVSVPPLHGGYLYDVAAISRTNVWIVGLREAKLVPWQTIVLHYDGHALKNVPAPSPYRNANGLYAVAAFGPRNVWAVGEGATRSKPVMHYVPLVLHYDGRRWRNVTVPQRGGRYGSEFYDIAGTGPRDIWAVGILDRGDWVGLTQHWNGHAWRVVPSTTTGYNAVAAISAKNAWAVGTASDMNNANLPVAHWDGKRWTALKDTTRAGFETYANGVSASSPRNVWVVGQEAVSPFVERFDGHGFTRLTVPKAHWQANYAKQENSYFEAVAALSASNVWAVGDFGIEHYDGHDWTLVSTDDSYSALTALSDTDMWAVGGGAVGHYSCR